LRQASALVQVLLLCNFTLQPAFATRSSSEEPTAWVEVCSNPLRVADEQCLLDLLDQLHLVNVHQASDQHPRHNCDDQYNQ